MSWAALVAGSAPGASYRPMSIRSTFNVSSNRRIKQLCAAGTDAPCTTYVGYYCCICTSVYNAVHVQNHAMTESVSQISCMLAR